MYTNINDIEEDNNEREHKTKNQKYSHPFQVYTFQQEAATNTHLVERELTF